MIASTLFASGKELPTDPAHFGLLRESQDVFEDTAELQQRLNQDGYLFIRGFFKRENVTKVRRTITDALDREGVLDPNFPTLEAIAKPERDMAFRPDLAAASLELQNLIYGDEMMQFYTRMLDAPAMHYDFTWLRVVAPGKGTQPHADVVYMGRGTHDVCTAWVPLGDVPISVGGLIVLEGSHQKSELDGYRAMDVDTACTNLDQKSELNTAGYPGFGAFNEVAADAQSELGGRWLTADYEMGDLLTFSIYLLHGSLDNGSNQFRMSSDSRYQRADQVADERWIGEDPPGHGGSMIKGMIC